VNATVIFSPPLEVDDDVTPPAGFCCGSSVVAKANRLRLAAVTIERQMAAGIWTREVRTLRMLVMVITSCVEEYEYHH
jgi:hypothetical protein